MLMVSMRMIEWAVLAQPLERINKGRNTLLDAADLLTNYRGIGWVWSRHVPFPLESRSTHSRPAFILTTSFRLARDIFIYDALTIVIRKLAPPAVGTAAGGSIFDASISPLQRYAHSSLITFVYGGVFWLSMNIAYNVATVLALCIPRLYQPSDWPPYSQLPLLATSVTEFWGTHWHQTLRRTFVVLSTPLRKTLGRTGTVLGAFFLSGVLHDWCMWGMGKGTNFTQTGGFFMAMGLGVLLEELWTKVTGRKVGGWTGWLWTMAWLTAWGNLLVDAWMRTGLGGGEILPPQVRPARALLAWAAMHAHYTD